jgi:hypothetical protein
LKAINFLFWLRDVVKCCPTSKEGAKTGLPSNAELRRWLKSGAVIVNGRKPGPAAIVEWPIEELVFFPSGKLKTTII